MTTRHGYPPGVPCWVDTSQSDPEAAVRFYRDLFGWDLEDRTPPNSPGRYFVAQLDGLDVAGIGSQPEPAPSVWNMYISVESADEAAMKVRSSGGTTLLEPFDVGDAGRMGVFTDPSGAVFCVWQAKQQTGAQIVNEPGAWNFSDLNTRDLGGAKAFYGAVFGWEAETLDPEGGYGMWRRPGYGDYLEAGDDPEVRSRQAGVGAPPGFEDAVAWLVPMTTEQFPDDVPPHWSVTFAVDDVDEAANRADRLGGNVLVPPLDTEWVRTAVLRDPQGAVFTASKFTPPG